MSQKPDSIKLGKNELGHRGSEAKGDMLSALTGPLFGKSKSKAKSEAKHGERGLDRDSQVYLGEQGTSHQAFTSVGEVGRSPRSAGEVAADSSGGVHLGYMIIFIFTFIIFI